MTALRRYGPGLFVAAVLAAVATLVGTVLPVVGAPVLALLGGAVFGVFARRIRDERFAPGLAATQRHLLGTAIVLLGLALPVAAVVDVGRRTAIVLVGTLLVGALAALVVGRLLALDRESAILVAVGTTICGASAIAAATAVIKPDRDRVAYALGTIFVFNLVAVLVYPSLGHLLGLSQEAFGLWAGTAINDTSSVLAAGVTFGSAAAHFAVIVKLVRSLAIVPMCIGLHLGMRHDADATNTPLWRSIPPFVVLFLAASVIAGAGLVPTSWTAPLGNVSAWLIAAVLAAIGTTLTWQRLRSSGYRPLVFGGILAIALGSSGLALQFVTGWR
ncbi:YeiH family protein [Nocardia amamiensis]|uniref:YeiH family protein n=1 Tax=Nocardia amamiensis TaxID=404578 RepID=UPI00083477A3|nr:putative sulfate exporter family transporter [Nocardia amamiensis]